MSLFLYFLPPLCTVMLKGRFPLLPFFLVKEGIKTTTSTLCLFSNDKTHFSSQHYCISFGVKYPSKYEKKWESATSFSWSLSTTGQKTANGVRRRKRRGQERFFSLRRKHEKNPGDDDSFLTTKVIQGATKKYTLSSFLYLHDVLGRLVNPFSNLHIPQPFLSPPCNPP